MNPTFPSNLQEIADTAFNNLSIVSYNFGEQRSQELLRLAVARNILSAIGYKDPKPPFQLPPPPPGMQWHREDGWTAEMLPQGWRPLIKGEVMEVGDSFTAFPRETFEEVISIAGSEPLNPSTQFYRTRRPLKFTLLRHEWTWHRNGDPMPCDGMSMVHVLWADEKQSLLPSRPAKLFPWDSPPSSAPAIIIGWRYADNPKSEIHLLREELHRIHLRLSTLEKNSCGV